MDEQKETLEQSNDTTWEDEPILPDETPDTEPETPSGEPDAEPKPEPEAESKSKPEPETPSEPEPDYKALYEGEKERQNAEKYRAVYNEQLSLTGNEAVARMIARNECGGKDYPLEDAAPETPSTDFRAALTELQSLYPDVKEMPESVMKDFMGGKSLKDAYAAHRAKSDADTIAALKQEIAALKKAESNRAAAPVKGSAGAAPEKSDPFMTGFDKEW